MPDRLFLLIVLLTLFVGCSRTAPAPASHPSNPPPVVSQPPATSSPLAASSASANPAPQGGEAADELARLQGIWQPTAMESDGSALTPEELKKYGTPLTVQGNKVIAQKGEITTETPITIDPSRQPKWIEWVVQQDNPDKGKTMLGIYEFDGDTLKICVTKPGTDRPADFTTKLGEPRMMTVYKRQK